MSGEQAPDALFGAAPGPRGRSGRAPGGRRAAQPRTGRQPAPGSPVARVMVDVPLPHLDRPFDYAVPAELDAVVVAGSRVRVRFAGRLVDAYVLERVAGSEHEGTLAWIERAVGDEPVLTPDTTALFRAVADRWAGSFVDVVRLGVPARHARAETAAGAETAVRAGAGSTGAAGGTSAVPAPEAAGAGSGGAGAAAPAAGTTPEGLSRYGAGAAFLAAVAAGRPARAVWNAVPGEDWPSRIVEAMAVALAGGRGALAVVPDARDLARLERAAQAVLGSGAVVALSAELGPAERYRRWLAVRRGQVRAVIGTRAAAYAPVADLGLLALWDDGDDLYDEPRAPYAHTRDVLVLRSAQSGAALLLGGWARTAEAQLLLDSGWAHEVVAERRAVRSAAPRVAAAGDDVEQQRDPAAAAARLPSLAWRTTRQALAAGHPVLVQVPRGGYVPALACLRDRTPARCPACSGPLAAAAPGSAAHCRWCGRPAGDWHCPQCGGRALRAVVVGSGRTAEELGRAFPGVPVRTSGGDHVLAEVPAGAALVVATPGAEPVARGGYGAALLLDGWALLGRADLRAAEETLRRWMAAAALVRPDGSVVVGADAAVPAVQALVRWDPAGFARRELADRTELGFAPAVRMAALTGSPVAVAELLALAHLPAQAQTIGPVPVAPSRPASRRGDADAVAPPAPTLDGVADDAAERMIVRVPRPQGAELAAALRTAAAIRSARRGADPVKLVLDPLTVL